MRYIKLFENFELINEDVLELKQLSKQIYALLKQKGFHIQMVKVVKLNPNPLSKSTLSKDTIKDKQLYAGNSSAIQIEANEASEIVGIGIPTDAIVAVLVGGDKEGWFKTAEQQFGSTDKWQNSPKVLDYVKKLGVELTDLIKKQYPAMKFNYIDQNWNYIMQFRLSTTKKGGKINTNQRANTPKEVIK